MITGQAYINGLGAVNPAGLISGTTFPDFSLERGDKKFLQVQDPGYRNFIAPDQLRRMSKMIRMGITSARICIQDSEIQGNTTENAQIPDAIITGTAWGCMEDTARFLNSMIENHESQIPPTSFIQSTHNTVAGQLAQAIQCQGCNFTYVHRGISFESALTDSMLQLNSGQAASILTGGYDELQPAFYQITSRMGWWRNDSARFPDVGQQKQIHTSPGEGASFLLLESSKKANTYAVIKGVSIVTGNPKTDVVKALIDFLAKSGLTFGDLDLILPGITGDVRHDTLIRALFSGFDPIPDVLCFKQWSGEYPTVSAFATLLSAFFISHTDMVKDIVARHFYPATTVPWLSPEKIHSKLGKADRLHNVLICNSFLGESLSFILLSKV